MSLPLTKQGSVTTRNQAKLEKQLLASSIMSSQMEKEEFGDIGSNNLSEHDVKDLHL